MDRRSKAIDTRNKRKGPPWARDTFHMWGSPLVSRSEVFDLPRDFYEVVVCLDVTVDVVVDSAPAPEHLERPFELAWG